METSIKTEIISQNATTALPNEYKLTLIAIGQSYEIDWLIKQIEKIR
jgi:hypothetical protein